MPNRQYAYQYDTNPRKIKPDYSKPKRNNVQKNKSQKAVKQENKKKIKKDDLVNKKKQEEIKRQKLLSAKAKFSIFIKCAIFFVILFLIIFRNTKISESFSQIQKLKTSMTDLQKENDQIEINIQNSINLNNVEQEAKERLGMQRLSNKQTFYISLSKKDYVEPRTEEVIIEEKTSFWDNLLEKIKNIF